MYYYCYEKRPDFSNIVKNQNNQIQTKTFYDHRQHFLSFNSKLSQELTSLKYFSSCSLEHNSSHIH